jgi:hypothetical protein
MTEQSESCIFPAKNASDVAEVRCSAINLTNGPQMSDYQFVISSRETGGFFDDILMQPVILFRLRGKGDDYRVKHAVGTWTVMGIHILDSIVSPLEIIVWTRHVATEFGCKREGSRGLRVPRWRTTACSKRDEGEPHAPSTVSRSTPNTRPHGRHTKPDLAAPCRFCTVRDQSV